MWWNFVARSHDETTERPQWNAEATTGSVRWRTTRPTNAWPRRRSPNVRLQPRGGGLLHELADGRLAGSSAS